MRKMRRNDRATSPEKAWEILENADAELIIPMNPRCESLNAAIAAAIVTWEIKQI